MFETRRQTGMDMGTDGGIGGGTAGIDMRGVFIFESGNAGVLCLGAAGNGGGNTYRYFDSVQIHVGLLMMRKYYHKESKALGR